VLQTLKDVLPGHTILPVTVTWHKPVLGWAIFLLCTGLGRPPPAAGQARAEPTFTISDAVIFGAAGGLYLAPKLFGIDGNTYDCLPCDPASLPPFDRWAVAEPRDGWNALSDVLVLALAAATWWDTARSSSAGRPQVVASVESAALATGFTNLLKEVVGRPRPIFYTDEAAELDPADYDPSFPSGHTAVAFAVATSYLLSRSSPSTAARLGVLATAVTVGVLRVASARHFPSDVVGGAVVGVGSALLVHSIKF
jgi:membrane-associated phospholipid phosphatase